MVHKVRGQTDPPQWSGQNIFWHWIFTSWATTLYPGSLFTSKHDRGTSFIYDEKSSRMLKTRFGRTWYSTLFGTPFADFFSREMGQNGVPSQLLLHFAPFLLQLYFLLNVDCSYKMTQIGSVGGEIWHIGGEKWGSRRRQLGMCAATGNLQAQV